MSLDEDLSYASQFLEGAEQSLRRAHGQRPDLAGLGFLAAETDKLRGLLKHLINTKREEER
jgi:hypothetical protein